jgi:prevent-host-death family protein
MAEKTPDTPVRIIGSRELHQNLPGILRELERPEVRYVLTVHGKPKAVLIGAEPYLQLLADPARGKSEALVGLQLTALLGGRLELVPLDVLERVLDPAADRHGRGTSGGNGETD